MKTGITPQGVRGFDGGKLITGRKRHILVDTCGFLLAVLVTSQYEDNRLIRPRGKYVGAKGLKWTPIDER